MPVMSLVDHAFEVADGNPLQALAVAVQATRWKLLAAGKLTPEPFEALPAEVWSARARTVKAH